MDALFGFGSGVAVNYISDELLQRLSGAKDRRELQTFKTYLEDWALNFQRDHDGSIAACGPFAEYVKNYHTVEAVIRYVILPDEGGMDERAFLEQTQRNMIQDLEEKLTRKLSPEDKEVVFRFLESLLTQTKAFVTRRLPTQEQILLYALCQLQARDARRERLFREHFNLTEEMLAQLLEMAGAGGTHSEDEAGLPREFDQLILSCNETLRKSQRKVKVYSWDDLPFDAVYVPPSFEVNLNEQGTGWFLKCAHENLISWLSEAGAGKDIDADTLKCLFSEADIMAYRKMDSVEKRRQRIDTMFDVSDMIYVIGGAGYGKSLFLQKLCVSPEELTGYKERPLLIVRGDLKRMIQPNGMFKPMRRYLEECFAHACLREPGELAPDFLDRCLKAGRCLVLLDALDEVGNDQRNELHQRVVSYFQDSCPGNKVCITSRDRGFIPEEKITCFTICPLTKEDVGEYVDRFIRLEKFPQEERERFVRQAGSLVEKGFVAGFLTLSLLLAIYKNEQELPANKVSLYERCFEYIANSREQRKKLLRSSGTGEEYDWGVLTKLMGEATFMHLACLGTPNNRDIPRERIDTLMADLYKTRFQSQAECRAATELFLQFCADRTEVFVPSPSSNLEYRFFHRSFYEFFYASYLVLYSVSLEDTYEKICDLGIDSEVFELLIELYYRKKPMQTRELLQYAFKRAEKRLRKPDRKAGKAFDVLIMLMQTADENDLTQRFIKLFMEQAGQISACFPKVEPRLIGRVFAKDPDYTERLYRENQKLYEDQLAYDVALGLLRNRERWNQLFHLERGAWSLSWKRRKPIYFRRISLLGVLPDKCALMGRIFENMKSYQYLCGTLNIRGKSVNALSVLAHRVCALPEKEQERIYAVLSATL